MNYSPWADLAARVDLTLIWRPLVGRVGEYLHRERSITLDPRMPRRQARSVLAHELVHAEHADVVTICGSVNLRQELAADKIAARRLIEIHDLADAMLTCDNHVSAMAVELRVSDALLRVRRDHLNSTERLYLRRRLNACSMDLGEEPLE